MSDMHAHQIVVARPRDFVMPARVNKACYIAVGLGVLAFAIGLLTDPQRAWVNFLLNYFYWLCIAFAGLFFVAIQHLSGATWSIPVRRIPEMFVSYLPIAAVLFIVLLFGLPSLYEWTHAHVVAHDAILQAKKAYLNTPFFIIRGVLIFVVAIGFGGWMIRNSLRQDQTGEASLSKLNVKIAAPFLIIFAWLFSFMSFDLIMSLTPHWFSTIFGVYCWAGLFYSGLAMTVIWTICLRKRGLFGQFVTDEHYHGLGKLMWAFLVFWAYIGFSQFMLIWYANLPEETPYMITRVEGPWQPISILLMVAKFWLPFFFIITQNAKRRENWLLFTAFWFLAAQWIDVYWMIFPVFFKRPVFGWMEVLMYLGFAGLFVFSVGRALSRVSVVAFRDPQILEGMVHHQ